MFALNRSWLTLAFLLCFAGVANADIFAAFSDDGGATFSDSYTVATGSSLTIDVFLGENGDNTELSDVGLFSLGLAAASPSAASASITDATIDPTFDFVSTSEFTPTSIDWEAAALNNAIPTGSQIFLGSFDLVAVADGVTIISFGDILPGAGDDNANWLSGEGVALDELIFGAGAGNTFDLTIESVSNVPEPNAAALLGLLCLTLAGRRRIR